MKTLKLTGLLVVMSVVALALSSCGGYTPRAGEKMIKKYDDGEMTKADWSECIDWVEAYYDEKTEIMEDLIDDCKDEEEFKERAEKLEDKYEDKWENIYEIESMLKKTSGRESISQSDLKRWEKVKKSYDKKVQKIYTKYIRKY